METENDSPDELEIVYPMLSRDFAPSRACVTGDLVPLKLLYVWSFLLFIIWPCLTRTGNYQIRKFDWLTSILAAV